MAVAGIGHTAPGTGAVRSTMTGEDGTDIEGEGILMDDTALNGLSVSFVPRQRTRISKHERGAKWDTSTARTLATPLQTRVKSVVSAKGLPSHMTVWSPGLQEAWTSYESAPRAFHSRPTVPLSVESRHSSWGVGSGAAGVVHESVRCSPGPAAL